MPDITLDDVTTSTQRLIDLLADLDDATVRGPSRLPGWTVGHVVSHIALNGDAFTRVAADRRAGRTGYMYPDGIAGRGRDINAGAARSAADIVAHLAASAAALAAAWASPVPVGPVATAQGMPEFSSGEVLSRRLREVEVHAFDIGPAGWTVDEWSDALVDADLAEQWSNAARRTPAGVRIADDVGGMWVAGEPTSGALVATRREILAWLLDRGSIAGAPELVGWGDQSRWSR